MVYVDRWGEEHKIEPESKRRKRRGAFAVIVSQGHILITWPNVSPDVPELPGGGIEEGESVEQALIREIQEEASVDFESLSAEKTFEQQAKYYANCDNEFWDYEQTYWVIRGEQADKKYFEGYQSPPDALKSGWVALDEIKTIGLHALHAKVLQELL